MRLTLTRDVLTPGWTLGLLHADDLLLGYTCEDTDRIKLGEVKVKARTAIPAGSYEVRHTWSPKYGRHMPEVLAVPGFRGIRIHAGNDADDTEGCILPGLARDVRAGTVSHSADAVRWLEERIRAAPCQLVIGYTIPAGHELPPRG